MAIETELTHALLLSEYIEKDKTPKQIASGLGCSITTVKRGLKKHNIRKNARKWENYIGREFGKWTIVGDAPSDNRKRKHFEVRCSCGTRRIVDANSLKLKLSKGCNQCKYRTGDQHHNWCGYKEISGSMWLQIVNGAKQRNLVLDVTIEYIYDLYLKQDKKCQLTGLPITFCAKGYGETTASLDRIDSSKGYVIGNVQWLHKKVNCLKQDISEDEFIALCKLVVERQVLRTK